MAQLDNRKYQLFPRDYQSTASPAKSLAPEEAFAKAMGQITEKTDKVTTGGLRFRMKDHGVPVPARRRKISVPELGPMTTVHESSMDSPTLPSRPVLHERSASAPGHNWKHLNFTFKASSANKPESNTSSLATRPPVSPKTLPPLTIPSHMSSSPSTLKRQLSLSRLRSGNTNKDQPRSARPEDSPKSRTPYTPGPPSATPSISTTPGSASTAFSSMSASTLPTPVYAVPTESHDFVRARPADSSTPTSDAATDISVPISAVESRSSSRTESHMRKPSDSSSIGPSGSIMERGRPKKPCDRLKTSDSHKKNKSAERRAFETLPKGWRVPDAVKMLDTAETTALNKQALQQAERFEVLRKCDVDSLSRELRNLDERCEYLRRTYHSLRAGRRNLHSRICSYLRSPRTVKFSQDSLLKQEEALAELDSSIDDWVNKLEQAENRRTRVRQKLLEHVAAAATLPVQRELGLFSEPPFNLDSKSPIAPTCPSTPPRSPITKEHSSRPSPRDNGASSPSPQRVVAQVPSTIVEQPLIEAAADAAAVVGLGIATASLTSTSTKDEPATVAGIRRAEVESIRIYVGDEVAALLADVEQEINRMSLAGELRNAAASRTEASMQQLQPLQPLPEENTLSIIGNMSEQDSRELHRSRSAEALEAGLRERTSSGSLRVVDDDFPTPSTTPSIAEEKGEDLSNFMLSSAVFNPKATAVY